MTHSEVLIALLGTLWASYGSGMNGVKIINDIRDRIIRGEDSTGKFSHEHRNDMLYNDWIPLILGTILLFVIFSCVLLSIPVMVAENSPAITYAICYIGALYPVIGTIGFIWAGYADFRRMRKALSKEKE